MQFSNIYFFDPIPEGVKFESESFVYIETHFVHAVREKNMYLSLIFLLKCCC